MGFNLGIGKSTPLGDIQYNNRHKRRNLKRVAAIVENSTSGKTALDIGCNAGYFSRALLESGLTQEVDAIEYDPNIVAEDLKADPRFTLHSGDALNFNFYRRYHTVVYGAVHHHIFANHGYGAAMKFWLNVIKHTDSQIFIESGQLAEGCRWYWQRKLREYYSTDEDYYSDLLQAAGTRLESVRVVDSYWIHGITRWLFKLELSPIDVPDESKDEIVFPIQIQQELRRNIGSKNQKLITQPATQDISFHEGVCYYTGTTDEQQKVFCKKYLATQKADYEQSIARQIVHPQFVKPLCQTPDYGLVFPHHDLPKLSAVSPSSIEDKKGLRTAVLDLFRAATENEVSIQYGGNHKRRLIDVIDMHPSNIFYDETGPALLSFDLEFFSLSNAPRNHLHLAKILWKWCNNDIRSVFTIVKLVAIFAAGVIAGTCRPPNERVLNRSPSVLGWANIKFRELIDKCIIAFIPKFRQ